MIHWRIWGRVLDAGMLKLLAGFKIAMMLVACVIAICVAVSFLTDSWIGDLLSQLRLVWGWLLLPILLVFVCLRMVLPLCLLSLVFLVNTAPVLLMYLPLENTLTESLKDSSIETLNDSSRDSSFPSAPRVSGGKPKVISLLNYNTEFQHNNNYKSFEALLRQHQPDLLVLTEVDSTWLTAISDATKVFPYSKTVIAGAGLAMFSKYPIGKSEVRYFGKSHHPRIFAQLTFPTYKLNLVLVHPPTPQEEARFLERNQELSLIASEIKELSGPTILVGDFNCGPWSKPFAELLKSDLKDSEQGFGPQPSWPARVGRVVERLAVPPIVPIDHVLVSRDIKVLCRTAGPAIGADHLPVFVKLTTD